MTLFKLFTAYFKSQLILTTFEQIKIHYMASKRVLKGINSDVSFLKEEDKTPQLLEAISSLSVYKIKELRFTQLHKIGLEAMNTLVLLVGHWVYYKEKISIHKMLELHGYSVGYYHSLYNRLFNLFKRGLVSCDKKESRNGYAIYYYPTDIGLNGVLGLLS